MKAFFEEYGFIILTCVVVISLIAVVTIFGGEGGVIEGALTDITDAWKESVIGQIGQ